VRELTEAAEWYEERAEGLGRRFIQAVESTLEVVRRNPLTYQKMQFDARRARVRQFPYSVIYRLSADEIVVLSIWHNSRNPRRLRKRL
jgi:plasmid stabilization system protein ParE